MSNIYKDYKPSSGGGDYLKLKADDRVKLRICSEPAISVYKEGDRPRYAWVVWNRELDKPQVYSSGISVYSQIADLVEEWGESPTEFDITIKRTGSGLQDTSYSVTPVKTSKDLTKEELEEVGKVDLLMAVKGKWLKDYNEDEKLPDPIVSTSSEPEYSDEDKPIDVDDIPY